jgi:endonuclease G
MKNYIVINVFIFLISYAIISCKFLEKDDTTENKKQFSSISAIDLLPTSTTKQIIVHDFYTLSYNEEYEQAEWVAYTLKKENLKGNNFDRPFFIQDKKVKTGSSDWRNYKNSGYDKGHLCPAGDMKFSKNAFDETFLTSNISPQKHDFNDGVWNRLEQKVRFWASKYGKVYVITGGVLNDIQKTIGREGVAVPEYFYKIIATNTNGKIKMIGFLIPHLDSDVGNYTILLLLLMKLRK